MKRILGLKGWATLLAGALVLGSCVEDEVLENQDDLTPKKSISFDAVVDWPEDYIEGRGAVLTNKANLASFNVWATLNRQASLGAPIAYFSDIAFTKQDSENRYASSASQTYYWPGEGPTLDFVAVGNKPASNFVATMNDNRVASFTYTVPTAAAEQNDVVVAVTDTENPIAGNYNQAVPLTFNHIMSAINVSVGTDMGLGTINSVKFTGIKNKGIYNVASPAWAIASDATPTEYPVPVPSNYTVSTKPSAVTKINDGTATLMLLPQEFTADAQIVVNFTPTGGTAQNFTAKLTDQLTEWEMGHAYNYVLNINPSIGLSLTLQVQKWEGVTIRNNFADDVSVNPGDEIKWTGVTPSYIDYVADENGNQTATQVADYTTADACLVVIDPLVKEASFKFKIAGPMGGTWNAMMVTQQGNPNAFTITPNEGEVGTEYTVTIKTNGDNNTTVANMAELRFVVRSGGKNLPVDCLTYWGAESTFTGNLRNGDNYIIVQNPVIN